MFDISKEVEHESPHKEKEEEIKQSTIEYENVEEQIISIRNDDDFKLSTMN